ncbi:MAG TPA: phosphoribosylanthranilate isomerase [Candidatus Dormibacteraeota bacterium]|nr:phosphoribosylanthranilate isomerase [Candidatus Dormibacteraeota bacterium]
MTLVKICGICDVESALAAVDAGADLLGFHFCDSKRKITPDDAVKILDELPDGPALVGVFIDQPPREVNSIAEFLGLDIVQLHGNERPGFESEHIVMKALKVRDGVVPDASGWPDPVLLDSWSEDSRGGTGRAWNWEQAVALTVTRKVFVAGGLNPLNVGSVIRRLRPYGVDVSSGVESAPRVKEATLIGAFVDAVRLQDPVEDAG